MRAAAVTDKGKVELLEIPEPRPAAGEVLLRVAECGICGSDLHALRNGWKHHALGHELAAVVEEAGKGACCPPAGTRVCAECYTRCGTCRFCRAGDYNLCESFSYMGGRPYGALADMVVVQDYAVHPVPQSFSDARAVMVEPLAVACRAVDRALAAGGERVAIIGAGTIGLLCAAVARARGASSVAVVAKHVHQAEAARNMGADRVVQLGKERPVDALRGDDGGPDAVIDTVALGTSFSTALAAVRKAGRVVLVGEVTRPLLSALAPLLHGELEVTGSSCYGRTDGVADFQRAIELMDRGGLDPTGLITHTVALDGVEEAFALASDKATGSIKVTVRPAP